MSSRKENVTNARSGSPSKVSRRPSARFLNFSGAFVHIYLAITTERMDRWKHAAACHKGSTIPSEKDIFREDYVLQILKEKGIVP